MNKKGQLTIFVVLGILIVVLGAFFYISSHTGKKTSITTGESSEPVEFIQNCFDDAAKSVSFTQSIQGGYLAVNTSFDYPLETMPFTVPIPYYFVSGSQHIPSKEALLQEFNKGITQSFVECLNKYNGSASLEYNLRNFDVHSKFDDNGIEVDFNAPIKISIQDTQVMAPPLVSFVSTRISEYHSVAMLLTREQEKHPTYFCVTCITDIAEPYGIKVITREFIEDGSYTVLYFLTDKGTNSSFFIFAHALKGDDL